MNRYFLICNILILSLASSVVRSEISAIENHFKNNYEIVYFKESQAKNNSMRVSINTSFESPLFEIEDINQTKDLEIFLSGLSEYLPISGDLNYFIKNLRINDGAQEIMYGAKYNDYVLEDWYINIEVENNKVTSLSLKIFDVENVYNNFILGRGVISSGSAIEAAKNHYLKTENHQEQDKPLFILTLSPNKPYAYYLIYYGYEYRIDAISGNIISYFDGVYY